MRNATLGAYYRHQLESGDVLKLDGFVSRSLFDLYSNFTFFLKDEPNGDEFQQHDSRLQQGANAQVLHPHKILGQPAVLIVGSNFHDNQILVALRPTVARRPIGVTTLAHARVTNGAGYVQEGIDLMQGRLHLDGGLRYDAFRFAVDDKVTSSASGTQWASRLQPKAGLAFTPSHGVPLRLHVNYGRGISSQDARGVVRNPEGTKVSITDFYQVGASCNTNRVSASADLFLIDRSNEQVYVPDDGTIEFAGPSRAYGFEAKASVQLTPHLSLGGGLTRVMNAFYRGTSPRAYVDSAPHAVANAALTLEGWRGLAGSIRYRHVGGYRLDREDAAIQASGLDVIDLGLSKDLGRRLALNLSLDNLTNQRYFETQNFFESRLRPGDPAVGRIHGTPGYPRTLTVGIGLRLCR